MTIEQKIEENYIFGCIKHKNVCTIYLMPIAYWILDYKKYDPYYNPNEWKFVFRDNILVVSENNIELYLKSIEIDKVNTEMFDISKYNLTFFIDFDIMLFVSSFSEIEVEQYIPYKWKGIFSNPIDYIPNKCKYLVSKNSKL